MAVQRVPDIGAFGKWSSLRTAQAAVDTDPRVTSSAAARRRERRDHRNSPESSSPRPDQAEQCRPSRCECRPAPGRAARVRLRRPATGRRPKYGGRRCSHVVCTPIGHRAWANRRNFAPRRLGSALRCHEAGDHRGRPVSDGLRPSSTGGPVEGEDHAARPEVGLGQRGGHLVAQRHRFGGGQPGLDGGVLDGDGAALVVLGVDVDDDTRRTSRPRAAAARRPRPGRRPRPRSGGRAGRTAAWCWAARRGGRAPTPARPPPSTGPGRSRWRSGRRAGAAARSRGRTRTPARSARPGRAARRRTRRTRCRAAAACTP